MRLLGPGVGSEKGEEQKLASLYFSFIQCEASVHGMVPCTWGALYVGCPVRGVDLSSSIKPLQKHP